MQFSNFVRTLSGNIILFKNSSPIERVAAIKYFTDNSSSFGFLKKEFRWSFNTEYWSGWETLTQNAISSKVMYGNFYLFLEIRYTCISENSGTATSFILTYSESNLPVIPPLPYIIAANASINIPEEPVPTIIHIGKTAKFSNFSNTTTENIILLKNIYPVEKVAAIKYFSDNSSSGFLKKEFHWSFNNEYWSGWETLTQNAISSINIGDKYYLFLEIRYTCISIGSGNVSSFILTYSESTSISPGPYEYVRHEDYERIKTPDSSLRVIQDLYQKYVVQEITNAQTLHGYPGSWYLDRSHQKGYQPISSITGLQKALNNAGISGAYIKESSIGFGLVWNAGYLDVSTIGGIGDVTQVYVDDSFALRDASITDLYSRIGRGGNSSTGFIGVIDGGDSWVTTLIDEISGGSW